MKIHAWILPLWILCLSAVSALQGEGLLLENALIVDGVGNTARRATLLVRDGKIEAITPDSPERVAEGVERIDLSGLYLLPGMIDAHVHISDPAQARAALHSGVTTARSMGVSHYADVGLRELIRRRAVQGPEMLAAGYHVRPWLAPPFFLNSPQLSHLMGGLKGAADYRLAAQANLERRVDFIKVVATDRAGLPDTDPRRPIMSEEEIRAVVELAGRSDIPVAAHAHGDVGARAAVAAGVRSIEHGTYLSRDTLELMRQRGTFLVPTLAVVKDLIQPGGDYDNTVLQIRGRHMFPRLCSAVREARALGVPVVAATDTGYGPASILRIQHDLLELVQCGLSPAEAIAAATVQAARLLGIEQRTGRIAPELEADLVAVDRNPLEEIGNLQDVLLVISDGEIVVNRIYPSQP